MTPSSPESSNEDSHLILLHGFLGLSRDWDLVPSLALKGWTLHKENLWRSVSDFDNWVQSFCERMSQLPGKKILLGYSLGGRLAMHALTARPDLFAGAIIVSANPGLKSSEEKTQRFATDQVWAQKFRTMPWAEVLTAWNAQAVLQPPPDRSASAVELSREEKDFDRELLAESLELWSLGFQKDLEPKLASFEKPLLFISGEADLKFTKILASLQRDHIVISGAGHRVPWDNPVEFAGAVAKFLARW